MSADLTFDVPDGRFNVRVVGVVYRERDGVREVLLQAAEDDAFWVLPGGRATFGEASDVALAREMTEEFAEPCEVCDLLWIVENFFDHDDRPYHELSFFYRVELPDDGRAMRAVSTERLDFGLDGGMPLVFEWFPLDALGDFTLVPSFLAHALSHPPTAPRHLVHVDVK